MTIKLLILKSGEDVIADVSEMIVGSEEEEGKQRTIGYFLNKPCVVKMRNPVIGEPENSTSNTKKGAAFEVSLYPWMPLTKDETIPMTVEWVITMVEPLDKLKEMYLRDVVNGGKNNQDHSTDEQPSFTQ